MPVTSQSKTRQRTFRNKSETRPRKAEDHLGIKKPETIRNQSEKNQPKM